MRDDLVPLAAIIGITVVGVAFFVRVPAHFGSCHERTLQSPSPNDQSAPMPGHVHECKVDSLGHISCAP